MLKMRVKTYIFLSFEKVMNKGLVSSLLQCSVFPFTQGDNIKWRRLLLTNAASIVLALSSLFILYYISNEII